MSRPISVTPDERVLWDLAFLGFSDQHAARVLGFHQSLFSRRHDLRRILDQAREERAGAMIALWKRSSQGRLRPKGQAAMLVGLVMAAEQRKIRRQRGDRSEQPGNSQ